MDCRAASIAYGVRGQVMCGVVGDGPIADHDWGRLLLRLSAAERQTRQAVLIQVGAARVSARQQARLVSLVREYDPRVALLTDRWDVRGSLSLVRLGGVEHIEAFDADNINGACHFLGLPRRMAGPLASQLEMLTRSVRQPAARVA